MHWVAGSNGAVRGRRWAGGRARSSALAAGAGVLALGSVLVQAPDAAALDIRYQTEDRRDCAVLVAPDGSIWEQGRPPLWLTVRYDTRGQPRLQTEPARLTRHSMVVGDTRVAAAALDLGTGAPRADRQLAAAIARLQGVHATAMRDDGVWVSGRFTGLDPGALASDLRRRCPHVDPEAGAEAERALRLDADDRRFVVWALGQTVGPERWPEEDSDPALDARVRGQIERFARAEGLGSSRYLTADVRDRLAARTGFALIPRYDQASNFYGGRALVREGERRWFIDTAGTRVHGPLSGDFGRFEDGHAPFERAGAWGIMHSSGRITHRPRYNAIGTCRDGICAVREGNRWGYVKAAGGVIVRPRFSEVQAWRGLYGAVLDDGYWRLIDENGRFGRYRASKQRTRVLYAPSEGRSTLVTAGGKRGFVDLDGKSVGAFVHDRVRAFQGGLAGVLRGDPGDRRARWGFIGRDGRIRIRHAYLAVGSFSGGLAPAQDPATEKWGYIDASGRWRVRPRFLRTFEMNQGIGIARLADPRRPGELVRGYVKADGSTFYPFHLEDGYRFHEGLAPVKLMGKFGYLSRERVEGM
ncbi:MAG: WG repeat-containing protein [Pseudomonadota bacterium]